MVEVSLSPPPPLPPNRCNGSRDSTVAQEDEPPRTRTRREVQYMGPAACLCSRFVLAQVGFNVLTCVGGGILFFWLLFAVASQGPYPWNSANLIGVVVGSTVLCSPAMCVLLAPFGMPEAVKNGWFGVVRPADCHRWLLLLCPYLREARCWRFGCLRHLALGCQLCLVFVPLPLLIAGAAFGEFSTWGLIWFDLVFEIILCVPCTMLGLLAFGMEPNYDRVRELLSSPGCTHKVIWKRALHRIGACFRLTFAPSEACREKTSRPAEQTPRQIRAALESERPAEPGDAAQREESASAGHDLHV